MSLRAPIPVQLQNKVASARNAVVVHGITFAQGEVPSTATPLSIIGAAAARTRVAWTPKGRRWPDGSVRYAKVAYQATFTSEQEKVATIEEVAVPGTAFAMDSTLDSALPNTTLSLTVNGIEKAYSLDLGGFTLVEGGGVGDEFATWERFDRVQDFPDTLAIIWLRLRLQIPRNQPYLRFWFSWGNSYAEDGQNGELGGNTKFVLTESPTLVLDGPADFAVNVRDQDAKMAAVAVNGTETTYTLIDHTQTGRRNEKFPFGTRHTYRGAMAFDTSETSAAALVSDAWGFAMDWTAEGKGPPPYGVVPAYPPFVTSRANAITRLKAFAATFETAPSNDPYFASTLLGAPDTTGTGAQNRAFGAPWRGHAMFRTGHPHMLDVILRDSYQLSCRPNWFVEPDGTRWVSDDLDEETSDDHSQALIWQGFYLAVNGAPDWFGQHTGINPNDPTFDTPVSSNSTLWWGPDRQHWAEIWEWMTLLATWDDGLEDLMLGRVETWIGSNYTDRGQGSAVPQPDTPRARGRGSMKTGSLLLECSGDVRVEYWLRKRIRLYWSIVNDNDVGTHYRSSRLLEIDQPKGASFGEWRLPDDRNRLKGLNWQAPWENAIASEGLLGAANVLAHGNPVDPDALLARNMAFDLALTVTMLGFLDGRPGSSTRFLLVDTVDGPQGATSMDGQNGFNNCHGKTMRGVTSNATGVIWWVDDDPEIGGGDRVVFLHSVSGNFSATEDLTIDDSTVTASKLDLAVQWMGARVIRPFETENYREPTSAELIESFIHTDGRWWPRTVDWYEAYRLWVYPAALVARIGVGQNYYGLRNNEVKERTDLIVGAYVTEHRDSDTGNWQNDFEEYSAVALNMGTAGGIVPQPPSNLEIEAVTQTTAVLAWQDNSDNETHFEAQHSLNGSDWLPAGTSPANIVALIAVGLSANTTYHFRVRAVNDTGPSLWSNVVQATTPPNAGAVPDAPSDLAAAAESSTQIGLTWTDNADDETGFEIEWTEVDGDWRYHFDLPFADLEAFSLGGFQPATTYFFRIRAVNANGPSAWSATDSVTTDGEGSTPPLAPTLVSASVASDTSVAVTWLDNSDNETGFRLERSVDQVSWTEVVTTAADDTSHTDTGLDTGTLYYYRVFAENAFGEATDGRVMSATPGGAGGGPAAPASFAAVLPALFHAHMT